MIQLLFLINTLIITIIKYVSLNIYKIKLYIRDKNSCNFFGTHVFACSNCSAVLVPVLSPIKKNIHNNDKLY